ncbi:MAG: P-loop NTPase [Oscillospiraceae bacterium]|jgi:septum site-determining protein MinD|nr:P-loop NTPase [Oscillospiraceae bacterium]
MPKVIAVTSGKGGTGKSSICSGMGYSLAKQGHRVLIIELDFGLRCIDIMLGMQGKLKGDLGSVLDGKLSPMDAVTDTEMANNLSILCAPENPFAHVTAEQIANICQAVKKFYDYVIVDTGAGINSHVFDIVSQSDLILVVTTPDAICVRDARMMSDEFYKRGNQRQRMIINKLNIRNIQSELVKDIDDIIDTIGVQLIGCVPEDYELVVATGKGRPIPYNAPSLIAFDAITKRIDGNEIPLTIC